MSLTLLYSDDGVLHEIADSVVVDGFGDTNSFLFIYLQRNIYMASAHRIPRG